MTAKMEVKAVKIDPSLMKADEREILEDLLVTALNDARRKAEIAMQEKMQALTGGLGPAAGIGSRPDMASAVAGPEIERLIQLLARLPGLGPRSARRAALHLIKKREALMTPLSAALQVATDKIRVCTTCGNIDTQDPCTVCTDPRRDARPSSWSRTSRISGRWSGHRDQRALSCARRHAVAARRRRPAAPQHRSLVARAPERQVKRNHPCPQCNGRRPDHRALHHRPAAGCRRQGDPAGPWRAGRRRTRLSR